MYQDSIKSTDKNYKSLFLQYIVVLILCVVISILIFPYWASAPHLFDSNIKIINIFICVSMFLVVWHTYQRIEPINIMIGYGLLTVALCETLVIIFHPGVGLKSGYHCLAAWYWLLARFGEGIILLISTSKTFQVRLNKWLGLLIAVIISFVLVYSVFKYYHELPVLITMDGKDTQTKFILEYLVITFYLFVLYTLRNHLASRELLTYRNIILALLISIPAEVSFTLTQYHPMFDIYGHILKVASFYYLYTGIFVSAITYPHEKLDQSREEILFQANLLDRVRNAIVVTDLAGRIVYWNKFAQDLYGWTKIDLQAKNVWEVIIPTDRTFLKEIEQEVLMSGYQEGDYATKTRTGKSILVHSIITSLKDDKGKPYGFVGISNDVTEKREIEAKIARLDRLHFVGEMAASIGHEIRNPLTAVRGFLQLLANKDRDVKEKEHIGIAIKELDRANSIITEYLSLAKNKKIEKEINNLNEIINGVIPLLEADACLSDKLIKTDLHEIPDIHVDAKECTQLLLNLVRNGLEAMSTRGVLTIKTYRDNGQIVLAIKDQGQGINPTIMSKLGTPFITTKEQGTGLGLAVCYSIAARHKAVISVETGSSGTTFYVGFST